MFLPQWNMACIIVYLTNQTSQTPSIKEKPEMLVNNPNTP